MIDSHALHSRRERRRRYQDERYRGRDIFHSESPLKETMVPEKALPYLTRSRTMRNSQSRDEISPKLLDGHESGEKQVRLKALRTLAE